MQEFQQAGGRLFDRATDDRGFHGSSTPLAHCGGGFSWSDCCRSVLSGGANARSLLSGPGSVD